MNYELKSTGDKEEILSLLKPKKPKREGWWIVIVFVILAILSS